jgi:cobalt-zinc-cadmium efflux system outer membrane protein
MKGTKKRSRPVLALGALSAVITLSSGCATVKPQPDYARAHELIRETTGDLEAYDPEQVELEAEDLEAYFDAGLTLDEAVQLALLNNRWLHGAFYEIGIARADWVQAGLLANPTLGIGLMFPEGGGRSNIQANLAQSIVDLWQMPVRRRLAEREVEQQVVRVARLASELAAQTKQA